MASDLLPSNSASGVVVTAGIVVAAYNVWRLVTCSLKNCRREHLNKNNNYGQFENFIDEIGSEIRQKFDTIKTLTEEVEQKVNDISSIERDRSESFINGIWHNVRMIEIEIAECKHKIAFALDKTREFAHSINDDEDKDKYSAVISNVATAFTSVAYVAFTLPLQIAAGAITFGNVIYSVSQYRNRKNERVDFQSNLTQKNAYFDQMRSEMERRLKIVSDSIKMAK